MAKATHQQLVDCIRMYQRGQTREDMRAADAVAHELVGTPADAADPKPKPRPRGIARK